MTYVRIEDLEFHDAGERPLRGDSLEPKFLVAFAELGSEQTVYDWKNDCWPESLPGQVVKWARLPG